MFESALDGLCASVDTQTPTAIPFVPTCGAVSGASFAPGMPLALGGLFAVFGGFLATADDEQPVSGSVGGRTAPLFYSGAGQINGETPLEPTPNTRHQLVVQHGPQVSVPQEVLVAAHNTEDYPGPVS